MISAHVEVERSLKLVMGNNMLYFITGNKNKFAEAKAILPSIEQLDIELPEIQEIDPQKIIEAKLQEAFKHTEGQFIVEDTSLYLDCLNGLPGPLIKWFLKAMGNEGLVNVCEKLGNDHVVAKTIIGYAKSSEEILFFEGALKGRVVKPQTESSFGWDPIFMPEGQIKTFAEMALSQSIELRQ